MVSVIVGLASTSLTAAVIPYFSEMVAAGNWEACQHTLRTYTRMLFATMIPVAALLIVMSPTVVRCLFQRGAFSAQDTVIVSRVQAMYALQIPFYAAGMLYVRMLTAMRRNDLVMISAAINLALDIVLNLICMRFLGVAGIALATSLFFLGSMLFTFVMARRLLARAINLQKNTAASDRQLAVFNPSLQPE
jgi:putative peptidoglycan lipid II flippase